MRTRPSRRVLSTAALLLFSGPALAQTQLFKLEGAGAGAQYGTALAVLGDLDADGADDFAVGSPREAGRAGAVRIHSGRTGAVLALLSGAGPDDFFGHALAAIDDVDGDGFKDLVIGAPEREMFDGDCEFPGGGFGPSFGDGYIAVVSGASGAVLSTLPGPGGTSTFGFVLAGGGDLDDDGGADFVVPLGRSGLVQVIDGATGSLVRAHDFSALGFTYSAAVLGPVDLVGGEEYVIGWIDFAGCFSGGARALSGSTGSPYWTEFICIPGAEYGFNVSAVGDLDADGRGDVLVCGLDSAGFACSGFGFARTLSGIDGALITHTVGPKNAALGRAATGLGDLDGDGADDLAVGQPGILGGAVGLDLRIESGSSGTPLFLIPPGAGTDRFGAALAAGDVNGDGLPDVLVGAPWDDAAGVDAGSVTVFTLAVGPTRYCESQINSQGCTPTIFATGTPSLLANNFRVKASNELNQKSGILFWGATPKQTAFSGGFLCVQAPIKRTPVQQSGGNALPNDCSGSYAFHFSNPYLNQIGLQAGDQVFCQYWSRDPLGAGTTNLTDAMAFTLQP